MNSDHQPIQYKKGYVEFYKLKFKVTPDVLIPRPETELLVDEVIAYAKQSNHPEESCTKCGRVSSGDPRSNEGSNSVIFDLGTGSGNIAISVAKNTKGVKIIATDISPKALIIAKQNAKFHEVEDKITFFTNNLLSNLNYTLYPNPLIIVTNLPYIPSERIPYLDSSVKNFEPRIALDGGQDGFELYRKLFSQISTLQPARNATHSVAGGPQGFKPRLIICEIDYTHGELAVNEALKFFPNAQVEVKTDLEHKQRILIITFS